MNRAIKPRRSLWLRFTLYALLLSITPPLVAQSTAELEYTPNEVYRSDDGSATVESLGNGVFLFRWWPGLYVSPFLVGDEEVVAVDPINRKVAALYRAGVAAVTDKPITQIIYSHEHLDHIVGADVLAPDAKRYAHPETLAWLKQHHESRLPLPTHTVTNGDRIKAGSRSIGVHYFGPNHGDSNLILSFDTQDGKMLALVDTMEIGIAPYRSLPDTNFLGYLHTLRSAAALDAKWVLGGHSGPGSADWIDKFVDYFDDMQEALAKAEAALDEIPAVEGEDFIDASERHIASVVEHAVDQLRPKYGHWRGFDQWAAMNAQTIRMAITVGK